MSFDLEAKSENILCVAIKPKNIKILVSDYVVQPYMVVCEVYDKAQVVAFFKSTSLLINSPTVRI